MRTFMKSTRRHATRTALLALSISLALTGRSFAEGVIDKVPADAMVVIKINDLSATSGKVAKLAQQLGLDMFVPQLGDPLNSLKTQLKITEGLDDNGEMAFVFVDPAQAGGDKNKAMVILVPTSDYKALVGNIEGATTEGNLTITQAADGSQTYIADWGGYAAASPSRELVGAAPTAFIDVPSRAAKELEENDVALFANMGKLRDPMLKELTENREKNKSQMLDRMTASGQLDEKFRPAASAGVDQLFNGLEAFLRDADSTIIGLEFTENGVKENMVVEFKEGSNLGGMVAKLKQSETPLLSSLPAEKYLMFGGFANSPEVINQLIDNAAGPVIQELPDDTEAAKIAPQYVEDLKKFISSFQTQTFALVTPQGPIGEEGIFQVIASAKGQGDQLLSTMKDFNEKYAKITNDMMGQGLEVKQDWTDNAKEVGGIQFSAITSEIVGDTPQANQARQGMQFMYGGEKVEALVGNAGDEVLTFIGVSDDLMTRTITTAQANEAPLGNLDNVQAVTTELPDQRIAELYISVDEIATTALRAANQFGLFQGNVQLPPDLQPIGLSLSSQGSSIEGSAYISAELMQALISAGIQASQRANGGGGDGGLE